MAVTTTSESGEKSQQQSNYTSWPPMELCQLKMRLKKKLYDSEQECQSMMEKCSAIIMERNMAPFYEELCADLNIPMNGQMMLEMKNKNQKEIAAFTLEIDQAHTSESDIDIKKMLVSKADYLMGIGVKDEAIEIFEQVIKENSTTDMKIACLFKICFILFFHNDFLRLKQVFLRLEEKLTNYSSWEEKNRFKVYNGLFYLTQGNFSKCTDLLINTIPTFNTKELISFEDLVCYAVSIAMLTLSRRELKKRCIDGQEVQEGLYGAPLVKNFLKSLYSCSYSDFLQNLVLIESEMKNSFFMHNTYQIYVNEIRAVAYSQLLESYSSLSLDYMSDLFGVTPAFMDEEISHYISQDKLNCKINKVSRTINTVEPNLKNSQYKEILSEGDYLLSQLQKLARKVHA